MRRDWRDTVRVATDVALLGFVLTIVALPLVTAGAAVAAASAAIRHFLEHDSWPTARASSAVFRRHLAPGLLAGLACAAAAALLAVDVLAVRSGAAPGGTPMLAVTAVLAAAAAGYAGLVVVEVGAHPDRSWRAAVRTVSGARVRALPPAAGVVLLAALLAVMVHPALVPVLAGYALYALHVVGRRPAMVPAPPQT